MADLPPPPPGRGVPPPVDLRAKARQDIRLRQARRAKAVALAGLLLASFGALWALSGGAYVSGADWTSRMTGVDRVLAQGFDGRGQAVCLVDTGVDVNHPDLANVPILAWRDFVQGRASPYDDDGHGTAMAGLIAARGALRGVAPGVGLLIAKALDARGVGTSAGLAAAIRFCVDPNADGDPRDGASVVSLSLAAASSLPAGTDVSAATDAALSAGVFVVASAGNDGLNDDGDVQAPASIPGVIAVGAVDRFGAIARFSSVGADAGRGDPNRKPELVAPGVDLLTTSRGGGYRLVSGTSPSAAYLSGVLALLLQAHPTLARSGPQAVLVVKTALAEAATELLAQKTPHDPHYGYGLVSAAEAMTRLP